MPEPKSRAPNFGEYLSENRQKRTGAQQKQLPSNHRKKRKKSSNNIQRLYRTTTEVLLHMKSNERIKTFRRCEGIEFLKARRTKIKVKVLEDFEKDV